MTGWRIGWLVLPEEMVRPVECLAQNLATSVPTLSQEAAMGALDSRDVLDGYVADYAAKRSLLLAELPKAGLDRLAPADGAFYLYADVGHLTNDSEALCQRLLAETGVALAPGTDFDPDRGGRALRISFAGPHDHMAEAARRLAQFFRRG
jgi:aspartate/methionine/tyrosine aminotransferase